MNLELLKRGQVTEATTDALQTQVDQASLQVREATRALGRTTRTLARCLMSLARKRYRFASVIPFETDRELPQSAEALVESALSSRPDLLAFRFGVQRASADVRLALANRFSDVYLLAQPYTYQDNRPFGLKSPTSWALGVTVPLPVYNRNQGNLERAKINVSQTRVELAALERQVADEVDEAIREFELSREAILEFERRDPPGVQTGQGLGLTAGSREGKRAPSNSWRPRELITRSSASTGMPSSGIGGACST